MYNIKKIKSIHLELTSKCQAGCPMCPRNMDGGMLNPMLVLDEIKLDDFKKWFPENLINQLDNLILCGNYGDPIIAKDCLEIISYVSESNPTAIIFMHTNGGARNIQWWKDLAKYNVRVNFGIDGLEDTHHLYRVGTDWKKILNNAQSFIEAGGHAEWHMLVFKHNEHQVEACETLSKEMGFKTFVTKHTSRFTEEKFYVLDDSGKPRYALEPTEKSRSMIGKGDQAINDILPVINCKAVSSQQLYVSATGTVSPCCWLDLEFRLHIQDTRIDYMHKIGEFPNLHRFSLEEIFDSGFFERIESTWSCDSLKECARQCGKFNRLEAQFS